MACKKSELISVINSYSAARVSNDGNLINISVSMLQQVIEKLEFEPEEETPVSETEVVEDVN
jgi:hypothetical protein